jgi:ubiquinone/menaquinone biosynthesis C-methylase UbiE
MKLVDFFVEMGKIKDPHNPDPLRGYINYVRNYIDDDLVVFCFDIMLNDIDIKQAENAKWSSVHPDFDFIVLKDNQNKDVKIKLTGIIKPIFQEAKKQSNTEFVFENLSQLVAKAGAIILLATGMEAYSLKNFSDLHRDKKERENKKNIPESGQTRLCFDPWQEYSVGIQGEISPCSELPGLWNFAEIETLSKGSSFLQQSLLQGNLNCVCLECKLKPVTTVEHLHQEVNVKELQKTNRNTIATFISLYQSYEEVPLPSPDLRFRISGTYDERIFVINGIQGSSQIMFFVEKYDHSANPSVLDWGCGCGRYANNIMKKWPHYSYTGSDIDAEAIAWCNANIQEGSFVVNNPYAPTTFANEQFSAVIASSVMTHLNKKNQLQWLKEIARILKSGGIFVASVLGFTAAASRMVGLKELMELKGIVDNYHDPALDGIAPDGYYRDVYQTEKYTRKYWTQFFDIKEYVPAGLMGYQDLVILQKKETVSSLVVERESWFKRFFGKQ